MEKIFGEEEFKGLEEEIDSAIEKLFVEKKKTPDEDLNRDFMDPSYSYGMIQDISSKVSTTTESEKTSDFSSPFEKMETQLLSLEWELTRENIDKTRQEILSFQRMVKDEPQITKILEFMSKILSHISKNDENIQPTFIRFLLDSKETIKLLMRKDRVNDIEVYKQLAFSGLEARYNCLEGLGGVKDISTLISKDETDKEETIIDRISSKVNLLSKKIDELISKVDAKLSKIEETKKDLKSTEKGLETRSLLKNITIVKVENRLFGIESDSVVKLFKLPGVMFEKYLNKQKIQLKEFDMKLIDLNRILSIPRESIKEEFRILTVKDNGLYKGFIIDEVVKRLSAYPDSREDYGEYYSGLIYTIYQDESVEIPILDIKKF